MPDDLTPLLRRPIRVQLGQWPVTVPWRPAYEWIESIGLVNALSTLGADVPADAVVALASGTLSAKDLSQAVFDAVEQITGMKWWVAYRLVRTSASPAFLGELTLSGVDPCQVGLGQWCAAVYRVLTRDADEKNRLRIDFELELPPPGYEESWDDDMTYYQAMVESARKMQNGEGA